MISGNERDAETGLDYFGARYFSGAQGRFTSADPARESANPSQPQTWNRFAYGLGNPLVYIDVDGQWPFYVHNRISEFAFRGVLSAQQIKSVQDASWQADFGAGGQAPANSPRHSMCAPNQTAGNCASAIQDYTAEKLTAANLHSDGGDNIGPVALERFGRAVHTLTDMGSPAHMGPNGPLTWGNGSREAIIHLAGERSEPVNWLRLGQSVRLAIAGFAQAFPKRVVGRDLNRWADRAISDYVSSYYSAPGSGRSPNPILEDSARQCALGNSAACFD